MSIALALPLIGPFVAPIVGSYMPITWGGGGRYGDNHCCGSGDGRLIRCIQGDLQAQNPPAARDPVTSSRNRPGWAAQRHHSFRVTDPVYHAAHENFLFRPHLSCSWFLYRLNVRHFVSHSHDSSRDYAEHVWIREVRWVSSSWSR